MTAIISPEGRHLVPPLTEGEGILVADLDLSLIVKRKRMMDSVGHYARPELLNVSLDPRVQRPLNFEPSMPTPPESRSLGDGISQEPADRAPDQRTCKASECGWSIQRLGLKAVAAALARPTTRR